MKNYHFGFSLVSMKNFIKKYFVVLMVVFLGFTSSVYAGPTPTTLTITSPNGGEIWSGIHNITWSSTGGTPTDLVSLVYSQNDFVTQSLIVGAENIPYSLGTYSWNTASLPDGNYKIKIISGGGLVFDPSDTNFTIDNTAPTISNVTVPNTTMKIGDVVAATITVGDDNSVHYTLVGGAIDGFLLGSLTRVNSTTYTATFTVTAGGTDVPASSSIPVSNLVLADSASLPNHSTPYSTPISQSSDPIDANTPLLSSVSISSSNANHLLAKVGDIVTLSFVANEPLAEGADKPIVKIAGHTISSSDVTGSGTTWTAVYTMQSGDDEGLVPFTIDFKDVALNTGLDVSSVTDGSSVTFDRTSPTIPSSNIVGTTIQDADDTIVVTFDSPVIPVDGVWSANEFDSITGSVTGGLSLTNASFNYSDNALVITLNKDLDGMYIQNGEVITVDPKVNAISDHAGNLLSDTAVVGATPVDGDIVNPSVDLTYSPDQTVYKAGTSVTVTATLDESVKADASKPKIAINTVGDGSVSSTDMTIGVNDTIWTYTWIVPAGSDDDGTATFTVTSHDLAGNANTTATHNTKLVDNTAPTLGIILVDTALKAGEVSLVTFTFSEPVIGFDNSDIVFSNGTLSPVSSSDGITWTATFTPSVDTTSTTNVISVAMTGLTDIAGNHGVGTQDSANFTIDTLRPTLGIVLSDYALKIGDTSTVTFTFSEVPTGFTASDVTSPNGIISGFAGTADPLVYTATFTPNAGVESATNATAVGTGWTDPAGNEPAVVTSSSNYAVDTIRPTVSSINLSDTALKIGDTAIVTITFSEPVTNFDNTDITTIDNGTLTPVGSSDGGKTWTATFTPNTSTESATNHITVTTTGLNDLAGNAGVAPLTSGNYVIDTLAPTLSSVHIASDNSNDTTLAKSDDTVTLTFTSSEAISSPTVMIQGFVATTVTNVGNNWTASRVMTSTDTEGPVIFSIAFADTPAGNSGVTVTTVADGSSVLYDRTAPTIDAGTDKEVNALVLQDATISDSGSGLSTYTWSKHSGTGTVVFSNVNGTSAPYNPDTNISISPSLDGTYVLRLTVTDKAGNSAYDDMTFIWDTTRPEPITSSPSNGATGINIADGTANVVFDEPVVLLDSSRVLLVDDATGVSKKGTVAVGTSPNKLNIAYSGLAYGTKYRINVKPNAVSDVATNTLLSNFISYFTTEIDTIPPVVNSFTAGSFTTTEATLSVTTNESSNCKYSTTDSAYGSMTAFVTTGGISHSTTLSGLTPATEYNYYVRCADTSAQANTMTTSAHVSFKTLTPDTTAPVITNIKATSITSGGVTITWTTDENATSRVEYDLTSSYGSMSPVDATADNTSHSVSITGLTSGTDYHFRVLSSDSTGNAGISGDNTFTTVVVPDTTAPAVPVIATASVTVDANTYVIAGTDADDLGSRTITLYNGADVAGTATIPTGDTTWSIVVPLTQNSANVFTATASDVVGNTSVASASRTITETTATGDTTAPAVPVIATTATTVDANEYTITGTAGADLPADGTRTITIYRNGTVVGSLVLPVTETDWSFVAPLLQNTGNSFTAYSTDASGNSSANSTAVVITEADQTSPIISSIHPTSITQTSVNINWSTDESSDTTVEYGLTSVYDHTTNSSTMVTSHTKSVTGLTAGTTYHYRVKSKDVANNTATSDDFVFTTSASTVDVTAPIISSIQSGSITSTGSTITWTTNENSSSQIEYGLTSSYGNSTTDNLTPVTSHSVVLSSLTPNTTYHFRVKSVDGSGNASVSDDQTFTTTINDTATLAVTGIDSVRSFATADNTFENGWKWTFHVTVPTSETSFNMKFSDFVSGSNNIPAGTNIRFYSAQSSNASDAITAIVIPATNTYSSNMVLSSDLSSATPGRQIDVTVEMRVPTSTVGGSYSTSYGVQSTGL